MPAPRITTQFDELNKMTRQELIDAVQPYLATPGLAAKKSDNWLLSFLEVEYIQAGQKNRAALARGASAGQMVRRNYGV